MADKVPPHVVRDLGKKLEDDANALFDRSVTLVDHADDKLAVAMVGLSAVLGKTAALYCKHRGLPPHVAKTVDPIDVALSMLLAVRDNEKRKAARG